MFDVDRASGHRLTTRRKAARVVDKLTVPAAGGVAQAVSIALPVRTLDHSQAKKDHLERARNRLINLLTCLSRWLGWELQTSTETEDRYAPLPTSNSGQSGQRHK